MSRVELAGDLAAGTLPLPHVWEHTVGSDHALMALRADWQAQLARCRQELGVRRVRFHGLLNDDVGAVVSFFNVDAIFDACLSIGVRPFVELSFMPGALASGGTTVFAYAGNVTPPRSLRDWSAFVRGLVAHLAARYGLEEIRAWPFEVWNEPNLRAFWTGGRDRYFELYRATAEAIKSVDPSIPVGGPASARNAWIEELLDFCARSGAPCDFVSTHHYPTDALGTADQDTVSQLAAARRSVLREEAQDARRRARDRPLYYTEWSSSSNARDPLHDETYAAAFAAKTALEAAPHVDGYSYWTFTDIFEESGLPSTPFHGGFGLLTLHGIPKPVYRAFELLHRLGTRRLLLDGGMHETVDGWVTTSEKGVAALLVNHALPRHAISAEVVRVRLENAAPPRSAVVTRIDETHANPRRAWREMGEPEFPTRDELDELERASRLAAEPLGVSAEGEATAFEVALPPHGVALVELAR